MPSSRQVQEAYGKHVNGCLEDDTNAWKHLVFSACCYMRDKGLVHELLHIGQKKGYSASFVDATEETTILHKLCASGDVDMLQTVICGCKVDIAATDSHQGNLLHVLGAISHTQGTEAVLQLLLDFSAKKVCEMAEQKDFYGNTPIHIACRSHNFALVDTILATSRNDRKPVLVQAKKPNGETPLHMAAKVFDKETVRFLLSRGSKHRTEGRTLNGVQQLYDENRRTPLESAIFAERPFHKPSHEMLCVVSYLLDDILATKRKHCFNVLRDVCWKAIENGARNCDSFLRIFALSSPTMLCECLEDIQDSAGNNILHIAAQGAEHGLSTLVLLLDILGCEHQVHGSLLQRPNKRRSEPTVENRVDDRGRRKSSAGSAEVRKAQSFGVAPLDVILEKSALMASGEKATKRRLVTIVHAHNREKAKKLEERLFPRTFIAWDISDD